MIERTLVLLKPGIVKRGLIGEVISRFERAGTKIIGMKMCYPSKELLKEHYAQHLTKNFYPKLEKFMTEGPVIAMVLEGSEVIEVVRKMVGSTEPKKAMPGTIRGDYSHISYDRSNQKNVAVKNVVHVSDSKESAEKEINLWFSNDELFEYSTVYEEHTI